MRLRVSLLDFSAFLFILLWGYTAISKIREFDETLVQLSQSPMIGKWASAFTICLPAAELALVLLLLVERTKRTGVLLSLALISAFTTYIILMLKFSYHVPCSCGGLLGKGIIWDGKVMLKMSWVQHIYFNLVFVYLGLSNILWPSRNTAPATSSPVKLRTA